MCTVLQIFGCLAITELAHGSDVKRLTTTATYDPASQQFIIHTPDYLATKCWAGNLGMLNQYHINLYHTVLHFPLTFV